MSAGKVHSRASLLLSGGFLLGAGITLNVGMVPMAVGSIVGIVCSPDQDVDSGNISNHIISKRFGGVADTIWRSIWWGYSSSLKHGSFLSHFPIIGTLGRITYLYVILIVAPHILFWLIFHPWWNLQYALLRYWEIIWENWRLILGLMASDLIHYFLDIMTTEHKTNTPSRK